MTLITRRYVSEYTDLPNAFFTIPYSSLAMMTIYSRYKFNLAKTTAKIIICIFLYC